MKGDFGKYEVYVNFEDYHNRCEIYIRRICEGEHQEYITSMEGDKIEFKTVGLSERIEPAMVFYSNMATDVLKAFANACWKNGFKPEQAPVLENELTATKFHLEDMRKLMTLK